MRHNDINAVDLIKTEVCYNKRVKLWAVSAHSDNFHAAHKDVNWHIEVRVVYDELKTLKQQERTQEEKDLADVMWIDGRDLGNMLTQEAHRYIWERVREERGKK